MTIRRFRDSCTDMNSYLKGHVARSLEFSPMNMIVALALAGCDPNVSKAVLLATPS